ncbi:MAG: hypothetical protein LBS60_07295 [Deltaproteobacteria bacterium]|jgi:hypothetical protein|nr:hypothetical protein [Deltaproteobacteria bacterium]
MPTIGEIVGDPYLDSEEFKKLSPIHKRWYYETTSSPHATPDWIASQEAFHEHVRKVRATPESKANFAAIQKIAKQNHDHLIAWHQYGRELAKKIMEEDYDPSIYDYIDKL